MNRVDEIIQELCPEGVAHKELGEVLGTVEGSNRKIVKSKIQENGEYPVYTQGANQKPDGYSDDEEAAISDTPLILYGDHTNVLKWIDHDFIAGADGVKLVKSSQDSGLDNRFLYHCLRDKIKQIPSGYARHFAQLRKLTIPIPPLEVQKEIINILDKFTQLEAELSAELDVRRKQYEYYRNQLVGKYVFSSTNWVPLESVMTIKTGTKPSVIEQTPDGVPYINAGNEPSGYTNDKNTDGGVITIPSRGQGSAGHVGYQEQDFWCGPLCYRVDSTTDRLLNKFVYYYLKNIQSKIVGLRKIGSIPAVNKSDLGKVMIPTPPIYEQEKTINILDNFDRLANDINEGIPAEITARRQQYEYYRTKLLTFQELPV